MLKKTLRDAFIVAGIIFIFNILIQFVLNSSSVTKAFENGVWMGLGVHASSFVFLYILIFLLFLTGNIARAKRSKNTR